MQIGLLLLRSAETAESCCCCIFTESSIHMNFCFLFSGSAAPVSSQHLRNIRKHCLLRFPAETLSVRGVCVMAFFQAGPAGHNVWSKWREEKTNRTTTENEMEGEDRGDKGNRIMNSRVLALSCLTCWLFCTMPFSRVVLLKRGLN